MCEKKANEKKPRYSQRLMQGLFTKDMLGNYKTYVFPQLSSMELKTDTGSFSKLIRRKNTFFSILVEPKRNSKDRQA